VGEDADVDKRDGVTYLAPGEETDVEVAVAGRLIFMRNTGKLCFATLQDGDGTHLQAMLSLAEVGQEALDSWKADVDLGDFVSVRGRVIASRRGELSIMASSWQMAAKALRPLPVAFADMSEDTRVRHRYTDLIMREQARTNAMTRIKVMRALRNHLELRPQITQRDGAVDGDGVGLHAGVDELLTLLTTDAQLFGEVLGILLLGHGFQG